MERSNLQVVTSYCRLMASGFEPLEDSIFQVIYDAHIDPDAVAVPGDKELLICALHVVRGLCENSRGEGGASVSLDIESVHQNMKWYCKRFGLDPREYLDDGGYQRMVRDGSKLW